MASAGDSKQTHQSGLGEAEMILIRKPWLACLCLLILVSANAAATPQSPSDWAPRIRALVGEGHLIQAGNVINDWLKASPGNMDARAWRARLQAWTNQWKDAEREYRDLIRLAPHDVDLLAGLADLLFWQGRYEESLAVVEQARALDAGRTDCGLRRAQALQSLGRKGEARVAYQEILASDSSSVEARRGLAQISEEKAHELRVGADIDRFSYTSDARAFTVALRSRWTRYWSTQGSFGKIDRFGEKSKRVALDTTFHLSSRDSLTVGGAAARDYGIIPRAEAQFEYGHGFRLSEDGLVRGVETTYQQRWLWYDNARLLVLSPTVIWYLPKDWNWLFRFSSSRIAYQGSGYDWKPSGYTRLSFPLTGAVGGHLLFATGMENYGYADQIAHYSARTWGGGLRIRASNRHEILGHGQIQRRSGGQSLASFGVSYAIRF